MRTTKRFTPQVLRRFKKQGRGTGTFKLWKAWHQVTRGDPASRGRSHVLEWMGRQRDLLSDGELNQQLFATMLQSLVDSCEQAPLDLDDGPHPLCAYEHRRWDELFPGTKRLADELGIRRAVTTDQGETDDWVMTTDLLLVVEAASGALGLLALAFKPIGQLTKRQKQLLQLEREYWLRRGATWLLITPAVYDKRVALTLRRAACWALGKEAPTEARAVAVKVAMAHPWASFTAIWQKCTLLLDCEDLAKRAIWQAIWRGELPIDLTRGWRPHQPLKFVTAAEFAAFNPILSGRSAWTD